MKTRARLEACTPSAFGVRPADALGALAVLGADYGVKSFASHAGARELAPLLAPTATLVTHLTGNAFHAESGAGYVSRELGVVIAPACSGINFAIVLFTALALGFVTRFATARAKALWLSAAAALAYLATVGVNALRICLALAVGHELVTSGVLSAQDAHRAVGVCVYLGCLLALCAFIHRALGPRTGAGARNSAVRYWLLVPLGSYVAVTVLIPLLHGEARGAFWTHAAVVGGAAGFVIAVLWLTPHFVASTESSPGRVVSRTVGPAGVRFGLDLPERGGERSLPGR